MLTLTLPTSLRAPVWSHKSSQPHPPSCTVVDYDTVLCWDGMYDFPTWSGQPVVYDSLIRANSSEYSTLAVAYT